mgnify:CR=1 FL=1
MIIVRENVFNHQRICHISVFLIRCSNAFQQRRCITAFLIRYIPISWKLDFRAFFGRPSLRQLLYRLLAPRTGQSNLQQSLFSWQLIVLLLAVISIFVLTVFSVFTIRLFLHIHLVQDNAKQRAVTSLELALYFLCKTIADHTGLNDHD